MNVFLPETPTVVIQQNAQGQVQNIASNISRELTVVVTRTRDAFNEESGNKPFRTDMPAQPTQVLARGQH